MNIQVTVLMSGSLFCKGLGLCSLSIYGGKEVAEELQPNNLGSRLAALYKFTLKAPKVHDLIHQDFGSIAIRIPSGANQNFWLPR